MFTFLLKVRPEARGFVLPNSQAAPSAEQDADGAEGQEQMRRVDVGLGPGEHVEHFWVNAVGGTP